MKLRIKDISTIALLAVILFVQEEILNFLPNISLTVFLIVLYSKKLGFIKSSIIVLIYILLDCIYMGSLNIIYTLPMIVGWLIIPISLNTIFKGVENSFVLSLLGILFSLLYSWCFAIANVLVLNVNFIAYLTSDLIFETLLMISSFLSIYWLYEPCAEVFDKIMKN